MVVEEGGEQMGMDVISCLVEEVVESDLALWKCEKELEEDVQIPP